MDAIIRPHPAS